MRQAIFINLAYNIPNDDGGVGLGRYSQDVDRAVAKLSVYAILPFMCFSN